MRPKYERSQLVAAGGAKIWSFGPSEPYMGELYTSEPYTGERPDERRLHNMAVTVSANPP